MKTKTLTLLRVIVLFVAFAIPSDSYCPSSSTSSSSLAATVRQQQQIRLRWKIRQQKQWQWQQYACDTVGNAVDNEKENDNNSLDRRSFLWISPSSLGVLSSSLLFVGGGGPQPADAVVAAKAAADVVVFKDKKDKDNKELLSYGVLSDEIVESLVYERILGSGSYKTVYLVSGTMPTTDNDGNANDNANGIASTVHYALAVERLRNKRDVKNAFRGVRIPDLIRQGLEDSSNKMYDGDNNNNNDNDNNSNDDDDDGDLFETIVDWWVQSSNVPEYAQGRRIFPTETEKNVERQRTRSKPRKNFVGSRWMMSFKPVYETDLKRFIRNAPVLYPVGVDDNDDDNENDSDSDSDKMKIIPVVVDHQRDGDDDSPIIDNNNNNKLLLHVPTSLSYYWTEPVLLNFVLEILHAGKLMHDAGIVHRDIKPKNMMISLLSSSSSSPGSTSSRRRRPVIIDYGFSELGSPVVVNDRGGRTTAKKEKEKDICVVHPGQLKGEVEYVLAEDLANYRGCQRGDTYAMGKTLYEFVFGSALLQLQKQEPQEAILSVDEAELQNEKFWNLLFDDDDDDDDDDDTTTAGNESRFHLSRGAADCLLSIIRGLCSRQDDSVLSFAEAEQILSDFLSHYSSSG